MIDMEKMMCPHCNKIVTPQEMDCNFEQELFDFVKFYCPNCGKEM